MSSVWEVFHYLPWQFFVVVASVGILLAAIACAPTALVQWVYDKIRERQSRSRSAR
jgi:hypothetical protein